MGNVHDRKRPTYLLPGRRRDRSDCERKLNALQVECYKREPHLSPHSPDFLRAKRVKNVVDDCCSWLGTSRPGHSNSTMWYESDAQGTVYVLGPADMDSNNKPVRIHNVLQLDSPPVSSSNAHQCTALGDIAPHRHNNEPALAIVVEEVGSKVQAVCRLGRLYTDPNDDSILHFFPCGFGHDRAYVVRQEQVAALLPPFPPGMQERCLRHGAAPGHRGAPGSGVHPRRQTREEAQQALSNCASTAATLTTAVQAALHAIESGTSAKVQRDALEKVKAELRHAESGFASEKCKSKVLVFLRKAEPIVCLAEANAALREEGHEEIPMGATEAEDIAHMQTIAKKLRHTHSTSRAVGVMMRCLKEKSHALDAGVSHARTDLDKACEKIPAIADILNEVHNASSQKKRLAVQKLQTILPHIALSSTDRKECMNAANKYLSAANDDRCRDLVGARPGDDLARAALNRLYQVRSGEHGVDCEEYECLKHIDNQNETNTAEEALTTSELIETAKNRVSELRSKCNRHSRTLQAALDHLGSDREWEMLLDEAKKSNDSKCQDAVYEYISRTADAIQKKRQECGINDGVNIQKRRGSKAVRRK